MAPGYSALPPVVMPLVACVSAGCAALLYSAFRTAFYSGEVHWTASTRQDELQGDIAIEKNKTFNRHSVYHVLGEMWPLNHPFPDPSFCKPEDKSVQCKHLKELRLFGKSAHL
eukprot:TRINITY_DN2820_c0_g3_i7.p1 TRINITY_DN2820_c0_g3~~TRINITY_DN2820_c0_g3_i7.p1  ORF type:complete len:113 (+),score=8.78 TRINITY_DN2820_c0_g3_i7:97-435(+)